MRSAQRSKTPTIYTRDHAHAESARESIAKYTKLPPYAMASIVIPDALEAALPSSAMAYRNIFDGSGFYSGKALFLASPAIARLFLVAKNAATTVPIEWRFPLCGILRRAPNFAERVKFRSMSGLSA
jgi:hypothetical protein